MDILQYGFMQRALIVALLISVLIPLIGVVVVLKRLTTMGESLSHTSLAGVSVGLVAGLNPILMATAFSIVASLAVEYIRKSFPKYTEIATNVVLSAGIGLAAVMSGFVKSAADLNSYLFGSLITVSSSELLLIGGLSAVVIFANILLRKELYAITLDEGAAKLSGIPVGAINLAFTVMTAVTISIAARTVGALMITSFIVLPTACAMMVAKSYKQTMVCSVLFAVFFSVAGLFISYYLNLKPGGTIVLLGVASLFVMLAGQKLWKKGGTGRSGKP